MSDQKQPGKLARILLSVPVPWMFVLIYLAGVGLEIAFRPSGPWLTWTFLTPVGLVIFALGAGLAAWGWLIFHRAGTTRVPGKTSTTLVTWGPYRFTRNPMYLGLSIAYIGEAAILHQLMPVVLLPLVIVYLNRVVIPVEEDRLHGAFGGEYERFRDGVGRWF